MWQVIIAIIQVISLILKNKFEKDKELRETKQKMETEAVEAIRSGDISRINLVAVKLRS